MTPELAARLAALRLKVERMREAAASFADSAAALRQSTQRATEPPRHAPIAPAPIATQPPAPDAVPSRVTKLPLTPDQLIRHERQREAGFIDFKSRAAGERDED